MRVRLADRRCGCGGGLRLVQRLLRSGNCGIGSRCNLLAEFRELFACGLVSETLLVTSCARDLRACVGGLRGDLLLLLRGLCELRILLRHRTGLLRGLLRGGLCLTRCLSRSLRLLCGLTGLLRGLLICGLLVAAFRRGLLRICLRRLRVVRCCVGCLRSVTRLVRRLLRGLCGLLRVAGCGGFFRGHRSLLCILRGGTGFVCRLRSLLRGLRICGAVCLLFRSLRGFLCGLRCLRGLLRCIRRLVRGLLHRCVVRLRGLRIRHRSSVVRGGLCEILRLLGGLRGLVRLLRGLCGFLAGFLVCRLRLGTLGRGLRRVRLRTGLRLLRIGGRLLGRLRRFARLVRSLLRGLRRFRWSVRLCHLLCGLHGLLCVLCGGSGFVRGFRGLLFGLRVARSLRFLLCGLGGFLRGLRGLLRLLRGLGCIFLRGLHLRCLLLRLLTDLLRDLVLLLRGALKFLAGVGERVL